MVTCGKIRVAALLCGVFFAFSLGAAEKRPLFTPIEVSMKFLASPRVKAGATNSASRGRLTLTNSRWGVIEISYTPRFDYEDRSDKKRSKFSGEWLEDVTLGVQVVFRDALGTTSRRPMGAALLSTRVEFWSIALDGRPHAYFLYIPPQLIERCMPSRDARTVNVSTVKDYLICVTFFHKKWGVLGQGYFGAKTRRPAAEFRELLKTVPTQSVFHGSIVPRSQSPWGLNDMEQFDLEKPAYTPPPLDDAAIEKAAAEAEAEARTAESAAGGKKSGKKSRKSER